MITPISFCLRLTKHYATLAFIRGVHPALMDEQGKEL